MLNEGTLIQRVHEHEQDGRSEELAARQLETRRETEPVAFIRQIQNEVFKLRNIEVPPTSQIIRNVR
jgi:hypothetical protein